MAYDPKVVTIWEGFKAHFAERGLAFDYLLYSNYEAQVEAQFKGDIAFAWNSPLAWVRSERMARARGLQVQALAMRDSDIDLASVLVVRSGSPVQSLADLRGKTIGFELIKAKKLCKKGDIGNRGGETHDGRSEFINGAVRTLRQGQRKCTVALWRATR